MRYAAALVLVVFAISGMSCIYYDWRELGWEFRTKSERIGKGMKRCLKAWERGDYDAAFRPCNKSAKQAGIASAEYWVGFMYDNGEGVPEDNVLAFMWLNLATAQGYYEKNEEHRIRFEKAEHKLNIIRKELTPEQIAEAERMGAEWSKKHEKFRDRG